MKITKIFPALLMLIGCMAFLAGCNKGSQVSGRSQTSAAKSASYLKDRLPPGKRLAFEVSFFTLRDAYKDGDEFLKQVDGKTPDEIIERGKEIYTERKQAGVEAYKKYATWDDMLASFKKERESKSSKPLDARERSARPTLYKL